MDLETDEMLRRLFRITEHDESRINAAIVRNTEAAFQILLQHEIAHAPAGDVEVDVEALRERALKIGARFVNGLVERRLI